MTPKPPRQDCSRPPSCAANKHIDAQRFSSLWIRYSPHENGLSKIRNQFGKDLFCIVLLSVQAAVEKRSIRLTCRLTQDSMRSVFV